MFGKYIFSEYAVFGCYISIFYFVVDSEVVFKGSVGFWSLSSAERSL